MLLTICAALVIGFILGWVARSVQMWRDGDYVGSAEWHRSRSSSCGCSACATHKRKK